MLIDSRTKGKYNTEKGHKENLKKNKENLNYIDKK